MPVFYPGNIISATEPTISSTRASGMWSMTTHMQKQRSGTWPATTSNVVYDVNFNQTTLLLKSIGANTQQNYTFLDSSTNNYTVTRNGDVTQGSFSPFGIDDGKWSAYFDGTGDYITVPSNAAFAFGTGDFTMEAWVYQTQRNTLSDICSMHNYGVGADMLWSINSSGNLYFQISSSAPGAQTSSSTVPLNTWTHIAIIRVNGLVKQYINGVEASSGAYATSISSTINFSIGSPANGNSAGTFYGYISNVRVVKGTAVYTSEFTPTTSSLTAISGTSLLTCQSNRFKDNSTNNFTITRNGDTKVSAFTPFNQNNSYTSSTNGGSAYFDGTGDYLTAGSSVSLSGDFTVECWVYGISYGSNGFYLYGLGNDMNSTGATFFIGTTGYLRVFTGNANLLSGTNGTFTLNQWNHVAFVRSSNILRAYLNGVLVDTTSTWSSALSGLSHINAELNGSGPTIYIGGACYISNLRVNTSAVYTTAFTPPTAPVSAISGTSLLMNGTNAGIVDASRKNIFYTVGDTKVATNITKYDKSIYLDGTGDYLTTPLADTLQFGTGNFTVECWTYLTSRVSLYPCIFANYNNYTTGALSLFAGHNSATTTAYQVAVYGASFPVIQGGTVAYNQWVHLAVVRSGTTITLYVNGTSVGTATNSASLNGVGSVFYIGTAGDNIANGYLNGYIEDFRITKGYARYTSNFTPPTTPLPSA